MQQTVRVCNIMKPGILVTNLVPDGETVIVSDTYDTAYIIELTAVKSKDPDDKFAYISEATANELDVVDWEDILIYPKNIQSEIEADYREVEE